MSGNRGRPPSALRADLRALLEDGGVDLLARVIQGGAVATRVRTSDGEMIVDQPALVADQLRAVQLAVEFGLREARELSIDGVRAKPRQMLEVLREDLDVETFRAAVERIRPIWES